MGVSRELPSIARQDVILRTCFGYLEPALKKTACLAREGAAQKVTIAHQIVLDPVVKKNRIIQFMDIHTVWHVQVMRFILNRFDKLYWWQMLSPQQFILIA